MKYIVLGLLLMAAGTQALSQVSPPTSLGAKVMNNRMKFSEVKVGDTVTLIGFSLPDEAKARISYPMEIQGPVDKGGEIFVVMEASQGTKAQTLGDISQSFQNQSRFKVEAVSTEEVPALSEGGKPREILDIMCLDETKNAVMYLNASPEMSLAFFNSRTKPLNIVVNY